MIPPNHYCAKTKDLPEDDPDKIFHDTMYGFPTTDDNQLFERLMLEINQAGLNWSLIMKKHHNFRVAYDGFDIQKVAQYDDQDVERLMNDAGIIRHKQKIHAAIFNAQKILDIRNDHGSFASWLEQHHPASEAEWTKLFRSHFKFTGPEIVKEFLMGIGYLPGAHHPECPVDQKLERLRTAPDR